jgi:hypothetical protein
MHAWRPTSLRAWPTSRSVPPICCSAARRAVPGRAHRADGHRARRPSAHAVVPRRDRRRADRVARVSDFGQSGDVQDLYRVFGIDADTIVGAALDLLT